MIFLAVFLPGTLMFKRILWCEHFRSVLGEKYSEYRTASDFFKFDLCISATQYFSK